MRWKMLVAIVLLAVGVGAVAYAVTGGPGGGRAAQTQYITATAANADVSETVVANGSLARATTYNLDFGTAPTIGASTSTTAGGNGTWSVKTVTAAVGDVVKKGAVLATADTTSLARDLSAARSSLSAAKSQKTIAKGQLDDTTTTDTRRQARIGYDNAVSQYTQAQGQVADLVEQIARAKIVAPADGTVVAVAAVAGVDISSGPAIQLSSGVLQATADFTESDLPALKTGQPASVTVDAIGASLDGTVAAIAPSAASSAGSVVTYAVTIVLTSPPATARPGMSAKASVIIAQATGVLAVPAVALDGSALSYSVLVIGQDGTAQSRNVTVGLVTSTQAEIKSGLQPGEAVVIGTTAAQTNTTTGGGLGIPGTGGGFQRGGGNGGTNRGGNGGGTTP
jgi:membrane fusion protein, macrolide-specific efflux system